MKMGNHIKVWFVIEASFSSLMKIRATYACKYDD